MKILVFADNHNKKFKKSAFETVFAGVQCAQNNDASCTVLTIGEMESFQEIEHYGASEIINVPFEGDYDPRVMADIIAKVSNDQKADVVFLSHDLNGKGIIGVLAAQLDAGSVSGALSIPSVEGDELVVKKGVYSSKAFAFVRINSEKKVVSLLPGAINIEKVETPTKALVKNLPIESEYCPVKVRKIEKIQGKVPLPEAEKVVSAGRGMKGPENWGIVEELAEELGAVTACSRPVSDVNWRPHSEHVGQTGIVIRPSLYVAVGISGAIQHLAGVNNSKTIVVINKDPEAPFFKAADYGVVGDLFDIVPRLTKLLRESST